MDKLNELEELASMKGMIAWSYSFSRHDGKGHVESLITALITGILWVDIVNQALEDSNKPTI